MLALLWFQLQGACPFTQSGFRDFLIGSILTAGVPLPCSPSPSLAASRALCSHFSPQPRTPQHQRSPKALKIQISHTGHCHSTVAGTPSRQYTQLPEGEMPLVICQEPFSLSKPRCYYSCPGLQNWPFVCRFRARIGAGKLSRVRSSAAASLGGGRGRRAEKQPAQAGKEKTLKSPKMILRIAPSIANF